MSWAPREARNWLNHKTEKRVEDFCQLRYGQGRPAFRHVFATENMNTELYHESLLQYETIDNVASYDFHDQNGRSYLPEIIRRLKQRGITPVFIRGKRWRDFEPSSQSTELQQYVADLCIHVESRGAIWVDVTDEARIGAAHFGPGDHLDRTVGRPIYSSLLADQLVPVIMARESAGHSVTR